MVFSSDYIEFDPNKKDKRWASRLISQFRQGAYHQLYSPKKAKENRDILDSENKMENIKKMFNSPEKLENAGFEFIPISVIEKIKQILIGEKWKEEIKAYVDSQDPSLIRLKNEDKNLLKSKKMIDTAVNDLKFKLGLPPSSINNDDFNGNYDDFASMGFDSMDTMDIENFYSTFYQLDIESDLQKIINHFFEVNGMKDLTYDQCMDLMATKTIAIQQYINKVTGAISIHRLAPESVYRIKGDKNKSNQKSDLAIGYYEIVTVPEFFKRAGNNFDITKDFLYLLQGLQNTPIAYTGVEFSDGTQLGSGQMISYSSLHNYTVQLGYIEHKSIDIKNYKKFENKLGNTKVYEIIDNQQTKEYQKIESACERTYYAWFLVTSNFEQYILDHGLLYHQETEGQEDEYSSFSIKYLQYTGRTLAEIAKPWIVMAQEAFTKFRFLLRDAKKDGRQWNLESLMEVSKKFHGDDGTPTGLLSTIEMFENSANEIYAMPKDKEGRPVPIQGGINFDKPNNFDTKFTSFKSIIEWAIQMIKNEIGINDMREGANPKTNDVYKLEKASLEASSNATMYLDNAFDYIYRNASISILSFTQDIVKFKSSIPYNYLINVIGEEGIKRMESMPKIAIHRQDIYVSSFASYRDRINVLNDTAIAFQKGNIDYATKVLIDQTNDHRKAQKLLVIKEQKALKLKQQEAENAQKNQMELEQFKTQNELLKINTKGQWEVKKAQVQTEGYIRAAQINKEGRENVAGQQKDAKESEQLLDHQLDQQKAFGV